MNKLNKIGVSALCGSLAAISAANAGELTVTGGADLTWLSKEKATTGQPIGMASAMTFKGSGELENGWTVDLSIAKADGGGYSNSTITVGLPGFGDVRIDQGVSGTGIMRYDDATPTVWEEADGAVSAGINKIAGVSAGGNIELKPSSDVLPAGLTAYFAYSKDADSGTRVADKGVGGSSGVMQSGWDLMLEAGSELHSVEGLTLYGGISEIEQFQNSATVSGDRSEQVLGIKYAFGSFTVGYQETEEETGITAGTQYDNTAYGITFSVNDDLSIGYNHAESKKAGDADEPQADSLQVAYTMGGASIRLMEVDIENATYSNAATSDFKATILSVGLAF
jgi:outer membrane protein OmpU